MDFSWENDMLFFNLLVKMYSQKQHASNLITKQIIPYKKA